jgi:hypothetical protein
MRRTLWLRIEDRDLRPRQKVPEPIVTKFGTELWAL